MLLAQEEGLTAKDAKSAKVRVLVQRFSAKYFFSGFFCYVCGNCFYK